MRPAPSIRHRCGCCSVPGPRPTGSLPRGADQPSRAPGSPAGRLLPAPGEVLWPPEASGQGGCRNAGRPVCVPDAGSLRPRLRPSRQEGSEVTHPAPAIPVAHTCWEVPVRVLPCHARRRQCPARVHPAKLLCAWGPWMTSHRSSEAGHTPRGTDAGTPRAPGQDGKVREQVSWHSGQQLSPDGEPSMPRDQQLPRTGR